MHRHITTVLILALSLFTATVACAAPILAVDQPVFDFGKIAQGKKLDHVFTIRNKGDAPLNITRTSTSCGCTVANLSSKSIAPGKSAELKTSFDSSNFGGTVTKTITLETNAPASPLYTLTIKGTISEEISIAPRQLNFDKVKAGTSKDLSLTVENRGEKQLKILSISSPMPQIKASIKKQSLKPGESTQVVVTVSPRSEDRFLSGFLSITTDSPSKPEVTVPLYGSVTK